tara:strand:- start:4707 stop:4904 length:198 start_codon:yes stop_codon:yes gene_type:complete
MLIHFYTFSDSCNSCSVWPSQHQLHFHPYETFSSPLGLPEVDWRQQYLGQQQLNADTSNRGDFET